MHITIIFDFSNFVKAKQKVNFFVKEKMLNFIISLEKNCAVW